MHRTIVTLVVQEPKYVGDSDPGVALGVLERDAYTADPAHLFTKQLSYVMQARGAQVE